MNKKVQAHHLWNDRLYLYFKSRESDFKASSAYSRELDQVTS